MEKLNKGTREERETKEHWEKGIRREWKREWKGRMKEGKK